MALSAAAHHSFDKVAAGEKNDGLLAQKTDRAGDAGPKQPGKRCSSSCLTKTPQGCGPGRRNGFSGTPWSTLSISSALRPWCRYSTLLCRRWWNSCRTSCVSSTSSCLIPEQVIEVPKIFTEDVPVRTVLRDTQLVEQLVEVPTIVSNVSLAFVQVVQRIAEQNVPAVGGSGTGGGLSGFLPGQHYSRTAEQIVDNPVPRPGGAGDLHGFPRGQSSTAFSEQIAEFPDPGGGRPDFQPVLGSAASSSDSPGQAGEGFFFALFPPEKSAKIPRTQGSELGASRARGRRELSWDLHGGTSWGAASSPCC